MYVPGSPLAPSTDPNFASMALDSYEFARLQPRTNMLWTEECATPLHYSVVHSINLIKPSERCPLA